MKVIILAAGEGTRLRPYTLDRPKCLVEVNGISLLDRQLAVLAAESIKSVVLVGGYRAEMLNRPNVKLLVNPQYAETNMVWTLFCAEADIEGDVIVTYGDIVYSRDVLCSLLKSKAAIAVAVDLDWETYWRARNENPLDDAETLRLARDGCIIEVGQKPKSLVEIEGQYMGLMKFSTDGSAVLKKIFHDAVVAGNLRGKPLTRAYMTDLLQATIDSGYPVHSVPIQGGWVEVDTISDLFSTVTKDRLSQIKSSLI